MDRAHITLGDDLSASGKDKSLFALNRHTWAAMVRRELTNAGKTRGEMSLQSGVCLAEHARFRVRGRSETALVRRSQFTSKAFLLSSLSLTTKSGQPPVDLNPLGTLGEETQGG